MNRFADITNPWALPFDVKLPQGRGGPGLLHCQEALRSRPGKRLACSGLWEDRRVFVKLFAAGTSGRRHWRKEVHGLKAMHEREVPAPELLYAGALKRGGPFVVVCEFFDSGTTFERAWKEADPPQRARLLTALLALVAQQHAQGLLHRDPHLGNFLATDTGLRVLDAGDVVRHKGPVTGHAALANLGLLLAQFPALQDAESIRLADAYTPCDTPLDKGQLRRLRRNIVAARRHRRREYLEKVYRDCSDFMVKKGLRLRMACERVAYGDQMRALLDDPDRHMAEHAQRMIKDGSSSTVAVVDVDNRRLVVKRYNIKGWHHALSRALRRTRADISWHNTHALLFEGLSTPRPVAFLERRWGPLRGTSYLVLEYVAGPTCQEYFRYADVERAREQGVIERLVEMLANLAALGIRHGDMKATNIILSRGRPVLLDVDALRLGQGVGGTHYRDARRFLANWASTPRVQALFERRLRDRGLLR